MRKTIVIIITVLLVSNASFAYAARDLPTKTKATRENILEDAVIDLLDTQMTQAAEKYYGVKNSKGVRFD